MREWAVFLTLLFGLFGVVAQHARLLLRSQGVLLQVGGIYAATGTAVWACTRLMTSAHTLHSHHYFNFAMLLPMTRFPGTLSVLTQAFCVGAAVEGISCWGMVQYKHLSSKLASK